jgi:ribosomal protein L11 methyltransferase
MEHDYIEMQLEVPAAGIDLVCHELAELGSEGVTVEERPLDTFVPPDPDEVAVGIFRIKAYFARPADLEDLRRQVRERLAWLGTFVPGLEAVLPAVTTVRNEDWAHDWKQHFGIVRIGPRLVIKPTWETFSPEDGDAVVTLDPGMAFGTGTHGTTRLCLEALAGLFEGTAPPRRVLDVGTGSGILAIAAAALGAEEVLACDIDAEACRTASENVAANDVAGRVAVTARPLEELPADFDVVLANILAEENVRLADALVSRLAPGGTLVLSGILEEKEALVSEAFARFGLHGPDCSYREEWVCLLYRRER